ncbi:MAG: M1 family aminopeptidase [Planctomycetota bacterium]
MKAVFSFSPMGGDDACAMRLSKRLLFVFLLWAGLTLTLTAHRFWPAVRWKLTGPKLAWPAVEAYELHFDLRQAGRFEGRARVDLSQVEGRRWTLLLNKNLRISEATVDGTAVSFSHFWPLPSRYHTEGRVVEFVLPRAPAEGEVALSLTYSGQAEQGRQGPDWRGILFVGREEARMCEQTIFYPQVPLSMEGTAKAKAPYRMTVVAPAEWELFVPAPGGVREESGSTRTWAFHTGRARHPSLLGGLRERTDTVVNGSQIVTLLRSEHAQLAPGFVREASRAIENYSQRFGAIETGVIGIVEIHCRDSSYNWAGEGIMAFDRGALSGSVPVAKVAHEVAHLWWGQSADATGPGERFLTEGLAEFSAWTYLLEDGRPEEVQRSIERAHSTVADLTASGNSLALSDVRFGVPDYTALAYGKGALVLRNLRSQLEEGQLDAALRRLIEIGAERQIDLDDFKSAVRRTSGREDLRIPWIDAPGDIALGLEEVRVEGTELVTTIVARAVPANSDLGLAGTPIAMRIGGRGWDERLGLALTGEHTPVSIDLGERKLAFVRLDPDEAWTDRVEGGFQVLEGIRLLHATPPLGSAVEFGGTRLLLEFDRALGTTTLEALSKGQRTPTPNGLARFGLRRVSLSDDGRQLEIETDPWLPARRYQLALTSLLDTDGLPIVPTPYELEIEPSTDEQPARILATIPEPGSRVVAKGGRLALSLTFDELMQAGYAITGSGVRDIERRGYRCPELGGRGEWDESGRTITYACEDLEVGETYALPIRERSFHDLSGNGCEPLDLVFTVVADE